MDLDEDIWWPFGGERLGSLSYGVFASATSFRCPPNISHAAVCRCFFLAVRAAASACLYASSNLSRVSASSCGSSFYTAARNCRNAARSS